MARAFFVAAETRGWGGCRLARAALATAVMLSVALLLPATASAATVFSDGFETGWPAPQWRLMGFTPGVSWIAWCKDTYMPVRSGNYALTTLGPADDFAGRAAFQMGPFRLKKKSRPRLEFDLYTNFAANSGMKVELGATGSSGGPTNIYPWEGTLTTPRKRWVHKVVKLDYWLTQQWTGQKYRAAFINIANYYPNLYLKLSWDTASGPGAAGEGVSIDNVKVVYGAATTKPLAATTIAAIASPKVLGAAFTASGTIKPAHASGAKSVYVYARRFSDADGTPLLERPLRFVATNGSKRSTFTPWSARVTLSRAGTWKVWAYHADAVHAVSVTGMRQIVVE